MIELFTNYELLKVLWWVLIGVLLIGFAITDGYDLGAAGLLAVIAKNDTDKRIIINAVAPHWDGNQVWFITAGGAMFAAWPTVYATAFSGFYWAMLAVLLALILRPISFEYRAKVEGPQKKWCDLGLIISGFVPSLIFGVAFGNLFQGYGYDMDQYLRTSFQEGFWELLNPFALLCGVVSLSMILMQGATWLNLRTSGDVQVRSTGVARILAVVVIIAFAAAGIWLAKMPGYVITSAIDTAGAANPLNKTVAFGEIGAWFNNYTLYPETMLAPVIAFAGALGVLLLVNKMPALSFVCSSLCNAGVIATAGLSLFPFIMPSSTDPNVSLTIWDATSSQFTLGIMTFVALVFVPLILAYTTWCFYKMWGRVDADHIEANTHSLY
ncbi:cytochrome d ubiquinol oxidase subunit II [Parendozoicomonas haliclonae]|uniref:Cytochrome bd-I ubiquinol oxidase subunit 2 n=1 Tax=Parendozoicomonas haliclonae TaxID=1960125 RepID=A0A1X7AFL4_9GAMM|nr:cytochrome d ubiquinol oxidase subunit II [Parendozoicomonas haliclonae]SMA36306.1 Cytochrome bd-I ubiquinol oxidase subunit 2 [Parendozoicomonas haliclonae]